MTEAFFAYWPYALLMIIVVSWVFYRFVAPKNWREWTGAGLVQAFIIALYAEMYGFPLTIYLLARFLGLDKDRLSNNLWSTLLGGNEAGMTIAMFIGFAFVGVGIFLLARGWREIHRASREGRLVTDGLYGFMRHPQYTGILLALFGEGIIHWPTIFSVGLYPFIVLAYFLLARREEKQMIEQFGTRYVEYQRRVPMFLPRLGQWPEVFRVSARARQVRADEAAGKKGSSDHRKVG